jgi:DNA-directed RNA polymerase subunit M/transcription elongation factor TFIIS
MPRRPFINNMDDDDDSSSSSFSANSSSSSSYDEMKKRCCPFHNIIMIYKDPDSKDTLICQRCGFEKPAAVVVAKDNNNNDDNNPSFANLKENEEEQNMRIEPVTLPRSEENRQRYLRRMYGAAYDDSDIKRMEKAGYTLIDIRQWVDDKGTHNPGEERQQRGFSNPSQNRRVYYK